MAARVEVKVETKVTGMWRLRLAWALGKQLAVLHLPGGLALAKWGADGLRAWARIEGGEWRETGARISVTGMTVRDDG